MKFENLRPGNIFNLKGQQSPFALSPGDISNYYEGKLDLDPEPISSRSLSDLGFESKVRENDSVYLVKEDISFEVQATEKEVWVISKDCLIDGEKKAVDYIHQLQSFYFQKKGKDLQ